MPAKFTNVSRQKTVVTVISKISGQPIERQTCLVVLAGVEIARKFDLDRPEMIIGRSAKAEIQIDQESVSRSHAQLSVSDDSVRIRDLGSTNGTWINDSRVEERVLQDGDFLKIGRTVFKFLSGSNIEALYHEEIYRLTTIDGLTQIYNKRYFLDTLSREISRCKRYGRELSLAFFDIDRFKSVNDSMGHLAGDYALKALADIVRFKIRKEDILARFGGEEFAVILPEIDLAGATLFGEKIRSVIEQTDFSFCQEQINFTISVGVASLGEDIAEADDLILKADERLYKAKRAGRNKVVSD